ncbi:Smr/MutS family protein, partial [Bacteroidota bacterium]
SEKTEKPFDKTIKVGDSVQIQGQETIGEVIEMRGKNCVVVFGNLKSNIKLEKLLKIQGDKSHIPQVSPSRVNLGEWNVSKRRSNFKVEIDVRGKRAEEALKKVTEHIDEAIMVGSSEIRILHGKGDGILRQLIRELLQTNNVVDWYGDEHIERGGAGITIVRFSF